VSDVQVIWDDPDDPAGNTAHVALHGLTPDEVDAVLLDDSIPTTFSKASGLPCKFGWTPTGRHIIVVWKAYPDVDPPVIRPVTAFEVKPSARP
jgi:hypothetical protein